MSRESGLFVFEGPNNCGKTTLATRVGKRLGFEYVNLDDDAARSAAQDDPAGFVADLEALGRALPAPGVLFPTHDEAIEVMDTLAPEHLEILTKDDDYYLARLKNYGSLFIGEWSTVAYADKGSTGTNHVLPTGGGAKYTSGLSVGRFLKPVTYQSDLLPILKSSRP